MKSITCFLLQSIGCCMLFALTSCLHDDDGIPPFTPIRPNVDTTTMEHTNLISKLLLDTLNENDTIHLQFVGEIKRKRSYWSPVYDTVGNVIDRKQTIMYEDWHDVTIKAHILPTHDQLEFTQSIDVWFPLNRTFNSNRISFQGSFAPEFGYSRHECKLQFFSLSDSVLLFEEDYSLDLYLGPDVKTCRFRGIVFED